MSSNRSFSVLLIVLFVLFTVLPTRFVAANDNTKRLRAAVTADGILAHLRQFQAIADANGGTRASGTPGYDASVDYVAGLLRRAGYSVTRQAFTFEFPATAELQRLSPSPTTYQPSAEVNPATLSAVGTASGLIQAVDINPNPQGLPDGTSNSSGCEAADFAGFVAGRIALVQRGTCGFGVKAFNAQAAGAAGVIIFNEGNSAARSITLDNFTLSTPGITIPVVGTSFAIGIELGTGGTPTTVRITVNAPSQRTTENVIAETRKGRADDVVVVGAHLDSVLAGPGINDNGSGSATILEIALQMARLNINPVNRLRFAFWGAEEEGLLGSTYYVNQLNAQQRADIALNLNFDMVGSPNYVRFVYDGDNSTGQGAVGPEGSSFIEQVFVSYFARSGLASEPTPFSGRSDYGPFIEVGIPAGGLFTGAEGIKSAAQAATYGGVAGVAYDPCYHQACDTLRDTDKPAVYAQLEDAYVLVGNVNRQALDEMADAAAHATEYFATTPKPFKERGNSSNAPAKGKYPDPPITE